MSRGRGPIRLVVTSRRVPVAVTEFELPYMTHLGVASRVKKRSIVYDYVLDEGERRILEEVRQAAERSGVSLEVVDLCKAGPLRRVFRSLLDRQGWQNETAASAQQILCASGWPSSAS